MRFLLNTAICGALFFSAVSIAAPPSLVKAEHGWVRWLPANLPAAGYVTIRNDGSKPVKLTGAESADYGMTMLHRSTQKNGSDSMEMVDSIAVPAHGSVALAPGDYHLMLMDAKHPIKPGDSVHITLHFSNGETLQATWPVRPANSSGE
ncbi:MAG: hypothetical protein C4338_02310 [Rhodanobacteraceae bacterium]